VEYPPAQPRHVVASWGALVALQRRVRRPQRRVSVALDAFDRWLVPQPRLPLVVVAALLAVFFLH